MGALNSNDAPLIQHSTLERRVWADGVTLKVLIYRVLSQDLRWTLEVQDHEGGCTCWDELFTTEQAALDAFEEHVRVEGIRSFIDPATRH